MTRLIYAAMALAFLSACDAVEVVDDAPPAGGPNAPTTPAPGTPTPSPGSPLEPTLPPFPPPPVPEVIAGNLVAVDYQPDDGEARITLLFLDSGDVLQQFQREADFDVIGGGTVFTDRVVSGSVDYRAFTQQEGPNGRFVTVFVAQSDDRSVQATIAQDGGRLGFFFAGADFRRLTEYVKPVSGLATYSGTYTGLINIRLQDEYVNVDTSLPDIAQPARATRTVGDVVLYADFADNAVEGLIFNRLEERDSYGLNDVILRNTTVGPTGSFVGEALQENLDPTVPGLQTIGTYGGVFGGNQASSVAGGLNIGGFDPDRPLLVENGIFVLNCDAASSACNAP